MGLKLMHSTHEVSIAVIIVLTLFIHNLELNYSRAQEIEAEVLSYEVTGKK
jgi:hypothetical protein